MENTIGIIPNTFHDFQKKIKSDTFENYKSFVPVEVQSLHFKIKYLPNETFAFAFDV